MSKKVFFKPKKIAVAVAATLLTSVAIGGLIAYEVDPSNLDVVGDETYIYPAALPTAEDSNGFIVIDVKEGTQAPGIGVYTGNFQSGDSYQGCIMASKGPGLLVADTCAGDPDTGKRFKIRTTNLNGPLDVVFNVADDDAVKLYNVYGKLTNDSGAAAKGFRVEIGTGIGANFVPSTTTDGVSLKPLKNASDYIGKYPGGLFGGSPAEGLPFFSTESAKYGFTQSGDALTTTGVPTQYSSLFGDWQTEALVPAAWFYDIDGRPWTDDKLVAYDADSSAVEDWQTFVKTWAVPPVITLDGAVTAGISVDLSGYDEFNVQFIDVEALTAAINVDYPGENFKTQDVVNAMLTILTLTKTPVDALTIADYAANPVTVRTSADPALGEKVATWYPDLGDEGLYVLETAYEDYFEPTDEVSVDVGGVTRVAVPLEIMQVEVNTEDSPLRPFYGIPGYSPGIIEDLSNVNLYAAVEVESTAAVDQFTLRITIGDDTVIPPPPPPPSSDDGGGCTVGGSGRFDPTLPALAAAGLVFFGLRRFKASK